MSTCQVNAEPLKQLPQRSASAAADDEVSMEPQAKVSRTHEARHLSQHTVPGQEEDLVMQQHARAAAVRRQDQKDKEATEAWLQDLEAQHILKENFARAHMRDQEAQMSLDFATDQTRAEHALAKQQTALERDVAEQELLLSCLPKKEGERAREQEEQSVPQRQADGESTSLRNQEEKLARDQQERVTREVSNNLAREAADKRRRDLQRVEDEAEQQKANDDKIKTYMELRAARVEQSQKLAKEAEAAQQQEEAAFKQRLAEQQAEQDQVDWSGDEEKEMSQQEVDMQHEERETVTRDEAWQRMAALAVQEREDQEIAETESAAQRTTLRRTGGLPTTIIQRNGDLFAPKIERHTRLVTKVFKVRLALCAKLSLPHDTVLPIHAQKEGQHMLFHDWAKGKIGKMKQQEVIWIKISSTPIIIT